MKTNNRKKVKASPKVKKNPSRARKEPATKAAAMPVDTFDAWISKQVRASNRGSGSEKATERTESTKLPESTFDAWMRKQKPKENSPAKTSSASTPDTFDLWISKRVAEWKDTPSEESVTVVAGSSTLAE